VVSLPGSKKFPLHRKNLRELGHSYWLVVLFGCLFTLARFSDAFLLLRAASVGMKARTVPALMSPHECRLLLDGIPGGAFVRPDRPYGYDGRRFGGPDRLRSDIRRRKWPLGGGRRHGPMGSTHGLDPGVAFSNDNGTNFG